MKPYYMQEDLDIAYPSRYISKGKRTQRRRGLTSLVTENLKLREGLGDRPFK